jgi:peptide-methionine (R)-S-oxide reductase
MLLGTRRRIITSSTQIAKFHTKSIILKVNQKMSQENIALKSDDEWRAVLTPAQFSVLREKATERPGTGIYNHFDKSGIFKCAGCGQPLYKSTTKFDSGCGWPAFYEGLPGAIKTETDTSFGSVRTEIMCSGCNGHLGHVFKGEGFKTPTDERHCVNSISLTFKEQ